MVNRGTVWQGYQGEKILGIDICPSWSKKVDLFLGLAAGSSGLEALGVLATDDGARDRWAEAQPLFQQAHHYLEHGGGLSPDLENRLQDLVGQVTPRTTSESGITYSYQDQVSVAAQLALEMNLEIRSREPIRFCSECSRRILGRTNKMTCKTECKRKRKQRIDRERYQRSRRP
jgi:hypothetical protein